MDDAEDKEEDVVYVDKVEYAKYVLETSASEFAEALYILTEAGYDVNVSLELASFHREVIVFLAQGAATH